jgi:hypothetical protein
MTFDELDLELDSREERRRWVEDERVRAGLEIVDEIGDSPVDVCLAGRDLLGSLEQLDTHPAGRSTSGRVEHVR